MAVTKNLAEYIGKIGVNISELARKTGIPYCSLYRSIGVDDPKRELRADELMSICNVLGVNPMDFANA